MISYSFDFLESFCFKIPTYPKLEGSISTKRKTLGQVFLDRVAF